MMSLAAPISTDYRPECGRRHDPSPSSFAMNICEQAETFRLLLLMGVIDKTDVIAWADAIIAENDSVPEWLLDVSLASNQDNVAIESKLRCDASGEWNPMAAAYAALERFAKEFQTLGRFTSAEAAHMLARWAGSATLSQDDWKAAMLPSWLADEVPYGHATDQQVAESIKNCIAHFRPGEV